MSDPIFLVLVIGITVAFLIYALYRSAMRFEFVTRPPLLISHLVLPLFRVLRVGVATLVHIILLPPALLGMLAAYLSYTLIERLIGLSTMIAQMSLVTGLSRHIRAAFEHNTRSFASE